MLGALPLATTIIASPKSAYRSITRRSTILPPPATRSAFPTPLLCRKLAPSTSARGRSSILAWQPGSDEAAALPRIIAKIARPAITAKRPTSSILAWQPGSAKALAQAKILTSPRQWAPVKLRRSAPLYAPLLTSTAPAPNFEVDLTTWLAANLSLPVYPDHVPQQTDPTTEVIPCCTYTLLSAKRFSTMGGPTGKVRAVYRIETFSYLHDDVNAAAITLRTVLHGFRGLLSNTSVGACNLVDEGGGDDKPANASDKWTYHRIFAFAFNYTETVTYIAPSLPLTTGSGTPNFEVDFSGWLAANLALPVYPDHVPEQSDASTEVLPCCTYTLLTADRFNVTRRPTGAVKIRLRIEAFSYLHDDVNTAAMTMRNTLHGLVGLLGNTTVSLCNLEDESSQLEGDSAVIPLMFEFLIAYQEPVTSY